MIKNKISKTNINFESTLYVGGSGQNNYTKIQDAIDKASYGDSIYVYSDSSPYNENLIINKSINLLGENRFLTIIDGNQIGSTISILSNYVNISRFTIKNCSKISSSGIRGSTNYSTISNNNIILNNRSGLVLLYSHYNKINGNIIKSNRWKGIHLGTCNNNIISHNIIISNIEEGINQYDSHNNTISANIISKNEYGINIGRYCSNNTISGNIILLNEYGISFYESNSNNLIRNNSIRWNMYGLYMQYSYLNKIKNNNFVRNFFNALFEGYYLDENRTNYWHGNFWNRPRILPKIIHGILWTYSGWQREPDFEYDRNPALIPNRIGG